jgi:hypothetical protein
MNKEQIQAIKCAYADLCGALEAHNQMDIEAHDWDAHRETIIEIKNAFDFIEPISDLYEE